MLGRSSAGNVDCMFQDVVQDQETEGLLVGL